MVIVDSRCGLRQGDVSQLGEVPFRVDTFRSSENSYSLRSAQAKRLITACSGCLAVESRLGRDTEIRVSFPQVTLPP